MSAADTSGGKPPSPVTPIDLEAERLKRWERHLLRVGGKSGKPKKVFANILIALRHAPDWKGSLSFDESAYVVLLNKRPPKPWPKGELPRIWNEQDDRLLTEWMQNKGIDVSASLVADGVETIAREKSFHPVREYLSKLKWDGTKRIDRWLHTYAGAEDNMINSAFGNKWLISAVARILKPGCKVDTMLILEGQQGKFKSTLLRDLTGREWFTDKLDDNLGDKDAVMTIAGKWIVECAELETMKGNNSEKLKAFLSREVDRYRPPYGRRSIDSKRQCVFCGTTNDTEYLRDPTGNRRYWPVRCSDALCDVAGINRDRDQLWAEAVVQHESGAPWWLTTEAERAAHATEVDLRTETDAWEEWIQRYLETTQPKGETRHTLVTGFLIKKLFGISELEITNQHQKRVGAILRRLGYERQQQIIDGVRTRVFVKKQ